MRNQRRHRASLNAALGSPPERPGYMLVAALTGGLDVEAAGQGNEAEWAIIAFVTAVVNYSPLLAARKGKRSGQTFGRQALGIRVVLADGRRQQFRVALRRHLAHIALTAIPLVGLVNHLWPLWDGRKQTLHDKLAGTLMVDAEYVPAEGRYEPLSSGAPPKSSSLPSGSR